jgi:hypothetical protein
MRWKWILMIGTILIIALMVTVYVVVATYDYNKLKPRIAQLVKDAKGYIDTHDRNQYMRRAHKYEMKNKAAEADAAVDQANAAAEKARKAEKKAKRGEEELDNTDN